VKDIHIASRSVIACLCSATDMKEYKYTYHHIPPMSLHGRGNLARLCVFGYWYKRECTQALKGHKYRVAREDFEDVRVVTRFSFQPGQALEEYDGAKFALLRTTRYPFPSRQTTYALAWSLQQTGPYHRGKTCTYSTTTELAYP